MKIWLAVSDGDSEPMARRLVGCGLSVTISMVQLHGQSCQLQTPRTEAKLGVGRSEFGRTCLSPSASKTERLMMCCVKPAQPDL